MGWAERLAGVSWLSGISERDRIALARLGTPRRLGRGELLWTRGERTGTAAVLWTGRLDVVRTTENGHRMLLRSLSSRAVLGLSATDARPHSADVVAAEESEVLLLPGGALRRILLAQPEALLDALGSLSELVAQLTDELEEIRFLPLDERLRLALARRGRGLREVRITHEELAQQVGATRENVSRALRKLVLARRIHCRRGRIEIVDL